MVALISALPTSPPIPSLLPETLRSEDTRSTIAIEEVRMPARVPMLLPTAKAVPVMPLPAKRRFWTLPLKVPKKPTLVSPLEIVRFSIA